MARFNRIRFLLHEVKEGAIGTIARTPDTIARGIPPCHFTVLHLPNGIRVEIAIAQSCESAANEQGLAKLVWTTPRTAEDAVSKTFLLPIGSDPLRAPNLDNGYS